MKWIDINERLPDCDYGRFLTCRHYHSDKSTVSVQQAFYIRDREQARANRKYYSRKVQGKNSVHFDSAEAGFIVTTGWSCQSHHNYRR